MLLALAPSLALVQTSALAAPVPDDAAGIIKTAKGSVTIERAGRKTAGVAGDVVMASDRISTGADGSAGITLRDETRMALGPNTTLAMEHFAFNTTTHEGRLDASVRRGTLAVVSGKIAKQSPTAVKFSTPSSVLGVRGTEFVVEVEGNGE
ncbi:hypothetical protein GJ700_17985 [Duganella sp. FT92W]|uniref:FecR protein domain-containing protein n=2 Tax=Pseudoduganella rivuli TaxID=2666085 RepID=A0A7X2LV62_9BURK|nr:hypothetical protein [Pseudoduganella rivuli]